MSLLGLGGVLAARAEVDIGPLEPKDLEELKEFLESEPPEFAQYY